MTKFIKYAAVGIAGYLVGFYEMKYKLVKAVAMARLNSDSKEESK